MIRHKFAEMATKIETARQMVYMTAWRFQNGEYPVREISMAKLYASRIAVEVADECIQIHGGAGYMKEYGVERVWRDMRLNRIGAGTDEIMLDVIGRSLRAVEARCVEIVSGPGRVGDLERSARATPLDGPQAARRRGARRDADRDRRRACDDAGALLHDGRRARTRAARTIADHARLTADDARAGGPVDPRARRSTTATQCASIEWTIGLAATPSGYVARPRRQSGYVGRDGRSPRCAPTTTADATNRSSASAASVRPRRPRLPSPCRNDGRRERRRARRAPAPPFTEEHEGCRGACARSSTTELRAARAGVGGRAVVPQRGLPALRASSASSA